ncbi:MAG: hypothetical protein R2705_11580 [Ilumatobacteraceae bacterium]
MREIFAPLLQVPVDQLLALGNSSLELMHDCFVHALLSVMPGSPRDRGRRRTSSSSSPSSRATTVTSPCASGSASR